MKTLVCLLGQPRACNEVFDCFVRHVINPLEADLLYCHILDHYGTQTLLHKKANYVLSLPAHNDLESYFLQEAIAYNNIDSYYWEIKWKQLKEYRGNWLGGMNGPHWFNGALIMYLRWNVLKWLQQTNNISNYDRFVITRPDYYYLCNHPPLELLDQKYIWITDGVQWRGVKDHYALCSSENVHHYLNLLQTVVEHTQVLVDLIPYTDQYQDENYLSIERFQKLHFSIHDQLDNISLIPQFGYIARTDVDPVGSSAGTKHENHYAKFEFEYQAASKTAHLVQTLGWNRVINENSDLLIRTS